MLSAFMIPIMTTNLCNQYVTRFVNTLNKECCNLMRHMFHSFYLVIYGSFSRYRDMSSSRKRIRIVRTWA